jgi:hypothetical protein
MSILTWLHTIHKMLMVCNWTIVYVLHWWHNVTIYWMIALINMIIVGVLVASIWLLIWSFVLRFEGEMNLLFLAQPRLRGLSLISRFIRWRISSYRLARLGSSWSWVSSLLLINWFCGYLNRFIFKIWIHNIIFIIMGLILNRFTKTFFRGNLFN